MAHRRQLSPVSPGGLSKHWFNYDTTATSRDSFISLLWGRKCVCLIDSNTPGNYPLQKVCSVVLYQTSNTTRCLQGTSEWNTKRKPIINLAALWRLIRTSFMRGFAKTIFCPCGFSAAASPWHNNLPCRWGEKHNKPWTSWHCKYSRANKMLWHLVLLCCGSKINRRQLHKLWPWQGRYFHIHAGMTGWI